MVEYIKKKKKRDILIHFYCYSFIFMCAHKCFDFMKRIESDRIECGQTVYKEISDPLIVLFSILRLRQSQPFRVRTRMHIIHMCFPILEWDSSFGIKFDKISNSTFQSSFLGLQLGNMHGFSIYKLEWSTCRAFFTPSTRRKTKYYVSHKRRWTWASLYVNSFHTVIQSMQIANWHPFSKKKWTFEAFSNFTSHIHHLPFNIQRFKNEKYKNRKANEEFCI